MKRKPKCQRKKWRLISAALCLSITAYAPAMGQSDFVDNNTSISVDAWSFTRHGNIPTNLYTGSISPSIPLYTYSDNDFTIPISIDYSSSGFMPNVPTGSVGMGWLLNAGGVITREIRDIPDEYCPNKDIYLGMPSSEFTTKYTHYLKSILDGYYSYYVKNSGAEPSNFNVPENACLLTTEEQNYFNYFICHPLRIDNEKYVRISETRPDIFYFNFLGHKGKFNMFEGDIHVYDTDGPSGEYRINLLGLRDSLSQISIMTGDGYKYIFGGMDSVEDIKITGTSMINELGQDKIPSPYTAWYLKCIEAPNGRKVNFEYTLCEIEKVFPTGYYLINNQYTVIVDKSWGYSYYANPTKRDYQQSLTVVEYKLKTRILSKISVDGGCEIDFTYNHNVSELAYSVNTTWEDFNNPNASGSMISKKNVKVTPKLTEIKVTSQFFPVPMTISQATLNYSSLGGSNPRYFLTSIDIAGKGTYRMGYHGFTSENSNGWFPYHGSPSLDHWGYFTGLTSHLVTKLLIDDLRGVNHSNVFQFINHPQRKPLFDAGVIGMLEKLTFPTGGHVEFSYESHSASKYVIHSTTSYLNKTLAPFSYSDGTNLVGGVRIKQIRTYRSNKDATPIPVDGETVDITPKPDSVRDFYYETENGESSGNLLCFPVSQMSYKLVLKEGQNNLGAATKRIISPFNLASNSLDNTHIEYSRVIEKCEDGSKIIYNYSNYSDIPDDAQGYNVQYTNKYIYESPSYFETFLREPSSHSINRGKLKSKLIYEKDALSPVAAEYYQYDTSKQLKYTTEIMTTGATFYDHRIINEAYPLKKIINIAYCENGSISNETRLFYNDLGQIIRTETDSGPNNVAITYNYYPNDKSDPNMSEQIMLMNNVVKYPLETINTDYWRSEDPEQDSQEIIVGATRFDYGYYIFNNMYNTHTFLKPAWIYKAIVTPESTIDNLNYYREFTFDYDKYGNIIEQTDKGRIKTTYIWGYRGLYLIAKIQNASLSDVQEKLGITDLSYDTHLPPAHEMLLRSIPNALVTTYKYDPFLGVTEICDPSGHLTYYEYTAYGKLRQIRNDLWEKVAGYEYSNDY